MNFKHFTLTALLGAAIVTFGIVAFKSILKPEKTDQRQSGILWAPGTTDVIVIIELKHFSDGTPVTNATITSNYAYPANANPRPRTFKHLDSEEGIYALLNKADGDTPRTWLIHADKIDATPTTPEYPAIDYRINVRNNNELPSILYL